MAMRLACAAATVGVFGSVVVADLKADEALVQQYVKQFGNLTFRESAGKKDEIQVYGHPPHARTHAYTRTHAHHRRHHLARIAHLPRVGV